MANTKIPSELIADSAITAAKLADGTITTADIADSNVTTAKIADSNVTTAKIGDAQVTTAMIVDANVTTAKIADNAITAAKLNIAGNGTAGQAVLSDGDGSFSYGAGGKTDEEIQDLVGAMFSSNTETGITATYQDSDGTIDLVDGQSVLLLGVDEESQIMPIDTVKVEAGTFSFSGSAKYPEMHYLNFEGVRSLLPLVLEPGTITVQVIKDSIQNASVRGTKSNHDVSKFLEEVSTFNQALREISFELRNAMLQRDSLNISFL